MRKLAFLQDGGEVLRAAAFVGFLDLGLLAVFFAGLAGTLHDNAPFRSAVLLYVGLVGIAAHALLPLGLWLGTPYFVHLAASDPGTALGTWGGFAAFLEAAGAGDYLFDGLAFAAAGSAIVASGRFPSPCMDRGDGRSRIRSDRCGCGRNGFGNASPLRCPER